MIHIGFTGTRFGMTEAQRHWVFQIVRDLALLGPIAAHHGDCVGADAEFHGIARAHGAYLIGHPPTSTDLRAHCQFDERRDPLNHLRRNRAIVTEATVMIAAPFEAQHQDRGGTWYTIDYTDKVGKPIVKVLSTEARSAELVYAQGEGRAWPGKVWP